MKAAALKTMQMATDPTYLPLSPENIETTRAAFPIALHRFTYVTAKIGTGIAAIGYASATDPFPYAVWVNEDGTGGWHHISPQHRLAPIRLSIAQRVRLWACRVLGFGGDE